MGQPMSPAWMPALSAGSLTLACWAEVWSGVGGLWLGSVRVTGGSVTDDQNNAIRRTCSGVEMVPSSDVSPSQLESWLAPVGNELRIWKGLVYPGGSLATAMSGPYDPTQWATSGVEAALLGTFLIESEPIIHATGDRRFQVSGSDRGGTVSRAKFTQPYSTDGSSTLDQAIAAVLVGGVPSLPTNLIAVSYVPAVASWNVNDDRWTDAALKLAADGSCQLWMDPWGVATSAVITDPSSQPVSAVYGPGAGGTQVLVAITPTRSNLNVPNWIIGTATGSGIATPLRADWQDTDVASPTYIAGPYPTTVAKFETSTITTLAQLQAAVNAQGLLLKEAYHQAQWVIIDNPAQWAGDVVELTDPDTFESSNFIVDRLVHTLSHATGLQGQGRLVA